MAETWIPPSEIAEFRLERRLGHGVTSEVWLARDTLLDRVVALKIANAPAHGDARTRFRVEARAVAKMQHPNLLAIHYVGEVIDHPYLVTEFLSGSSLDEIDRPAPPDRVVAIGIDLARGLSAAHNAGVLHRDIKPANAFLCDDGVAKLLDFGLAKLSDAPIELAQTTSSNRDRRALSLEAHAAGALDSTQPDLTSSDRLAGTPLYMAPETWRDEVATRSTDIYSLGALFFELLSGRPPIVASTIVELHRRVLAGEVDDLATTAPSVPAALAAIVARCLRLDPSERPTADDVCDALARLSPSRRSVQAEALDDPRENPYRGLLTFGPEHRALFFGREAEAEAVTAELRASPFVLVAGSSGAGKSSLVRAGVVPRVEKGALGGAETRVVVVVPGRRPIDALAQAMAPVLEAKESEVRWQLESPTWLADETRAARARVLLVVDQLEEIWTLSEAEERASFFEILAALTRSAPTVRIVATLRADFLERLEDMGELQAQALHALVVLKPMTRDGLRRAIVEPAARRGVTIEDALVTHLVDRTESARGAESGALPLLEFALGALYARRDPARSAIGLGDLDALGGVAGALAMHADATLARLPTAQRREARRLLLALVTIERTRSRREERDLLGAAESGDARAALNALVDARLVVAGAGEQGAAYEVAHEALLSGWPALRAWLDEEAAAREVGWRVRRAAAEWERVGRTGEALFGERQLGELDALAGLPAGDERSVAFLETSRAAVKRARLRRRMLVFGVPALVAVLGATGWSVSYARHRAAVAGALTLARAIDVRAEDTARAAGDARTEAIARFEKDDLGPAEDLWKRMLALEDDADRQRRDVGAPLDEALALDPRNLAARALYADVTLARLLAAERLHQDALVGELRARLDLYDDGSRAALLRAPARIQVTTDPARATLTLARYRADPDGRLVETDGAPLAIDAARELEPGSYLIVAAAPDRVTTRYPFFVRRGEERALRIVLPRPIDVPDGMIYVPAGRSLYGTGADEATRAILTHQPIHDIDVGAFLIARTEATNGEYLAFLGSLPDAERTPRLTYRLSFTTGGRAQWKRRDKLLAAGESYCNAIQPCIDWARLPVDGASREDGERFTAWLARTGRLPGARMCTDREWERAARGADDRRFPNGNGDLGPADACALAAYGGDVARSGPCAPATHPASRSPFGVDDMAGSESEWTAGPADIAQPSQGVRRGAGYAQYGIYLSIPNRGVAAASQTYAGYGLRVCADAR